ncbi:hypothetical protein DQ04_00301140 [Trypanosoma grayi]|uniref:hypothetical protein n=1 Tax=Trypanosoma grayi TaxID=71804 RepID=UPI0004F4932D|nr:hypothetical protein DQ04_00301140 [Trypanosoma grayi]KEG14804.1 hypothetical protein DQ04_00301140 [Trypanosoma grayi]
MTAGMSECFREGYSEGVSPRPAPCWDCRDNQAARLGGGGTCVAEAFVLLLPMKDTLCRHANGQQIVSVQCNMEAVFPLTNGRSHGHHQRRPGHKEQMAQTMLMPLRCFGALSLTEREGFVSVLAAELMPRYLTGNQPQKRCVLLDNRAVFPGLLHIRTLRGKFRDSFRPAPNELLYSSHADLFPTPLFSLCVCHSHRMNTSFQISTERRGFAANAQ